jgi:16S rRNA (adenine1518-N6/adenine1519-N6)-dimethyltransferase
VRSSFLRITPLPTPKLAVGELAAVERIVRAAFSKRRKTLANALRGADLAPAGAPRAAEALLQSLGIDPRARAESLAPERLLALARALGGEPGGGAGAAPWS